MITRDAQGNPITQDVQTGAWRPMTAGEIESLRPTKVLNEMGVGDTERFTFKNATRNPAVGLAFLRALRDPADPSKPKYEVHKYGDGWNAAVRPYGSNAPFKLVDPNLSADPREWVRDLLDLTSDVAKGALVGAGATIGGAVAGPAGAVAGGAAAGYGGELVSQAMGQAAGVPDNVAPMAQETVLQGVAGGAAPILEGAIGAVGRRVLTPAMRAVGRGAESVIGGTRRIAEEVTGKVTGIKPVHDLGVVQTLLERNAARDPLTGAYLPLKTPEMALGIMRDHLETAKEGPASVMARLAGLRDSVLTRAANGGGSVDMRGFMPKLQNAIREAGLRFDQPNILNEPSIAAMNDKLGALFHVPSIDDANKIVAQKFPTLNPGAFAAKAQAILSQLRATYQKALATTDPRVSAAALEHIGDWLRNYRSAWLRASVDVGAPPNAANQIAENQIKRLYGQLSEHIKSSLDRAGFKDYRALQAEMAAKLDAHKPLRDLFGYRANPTSGAENLVMNVMHSGRSDLREAIAAYDSAFSKIAGAPVTGPRFEDMLHEVALGAQFTPNAALPLGQYGQPNYLPQFGATGSPRASGVLGGMGLPAAAGAVAGGTIGGLPGAATGAVVGGTLAAAGGSPRVLVPMAPRAIRLANAAARAAGAVAGSKAELSALAPPSRYLLMAAAGEAKRNMGKGITEERAQGRTASGRPRRVIDLTR